MTMSLKEAAESTVHTLSDLVDEATTRLEDLPVPFQRRRTSNRGRSSLVVVAVLACVAVAAWLTLRRRTTHPGGSTVADGGASSGGARDTGRVEMDQMRKSA